MTGYVHKEGITDIEIEGKERSMTLREEASIRPLSQDGEAGKLEIRAQFVELRAKGWSYLKIAKKLKVSKNTLANWGAEMEGEIASLKAMELEALHEKYYMTKEARIELLGEQLKAVKEELSKRGLGDVSTDKLMEMQLKLHQALQEEYTETRLLTDTELRMLSV